MTIPVQPLAYRPAEAGRMLGVSRTTIYDMITNGRLRAKKIGTATVVTHDCLLDYLASADWTDATSGVLKAEMREAERQPMRFRQADLARALRAARDAGMSVSRSEIDADGKIVLVYGEAAIKPSAVDAYEEWRRIDRARQAARVHARS